MGTPQRRRRISVVADFGGDAAGEILFERESLFGHPAESGAEGEGLAEAAEIGVNPAIARSLTARNDGSPCADRGPNIVCSPHQGGCDGGGKGALVQTEKSGTLGTGNDQTIFTPTPINLMVATRHEALGRGTGFGVGEPGDPANTISAAHSHGVFAMAIPINDKATRWQGGGESRNHDGSGNGLGVGKEGDPSPTLTAGDRHGVLCMTPWDTQSARVYDQDGVWHSLNANENGGMARDSVLSVVAPAVALDMTHACDVIRECGEQVPALQARMGTGGNQVPLTYQMQGFGDYREGTTASSCKQRDYKDGTDLVCSSVDCRNFTEGGELNGTLQAKESGGTSLNLNNTVRQNMVVRRLTPLECTRLQGYPDGWVDIGDWVDEQGKKHKEADSPKYKALGNSIALPFWQWMIDRMAKYLPENATLGSLFDGIGGFPLCWSRTHSPECCRWASEIEPFPIAVTKMRFGED